MSTDSILIIGAGGHARVVLDAIRVGKPYVDVQVTDDNPALPGKKLEGLIIQTSEWLRRRTPGPFHVAIGSNATRRSRFVEAIKLGWLPSTIVHRDAIVAASASIAGGSFIAAAAIIAPGATVGASTIINHGAVIDHDCTIGDYVHIAPRVVMGGGATVASGSLVGAGAVVLPGISIGENAVVGAGATVTRNVLPGTTVVGVPAKPVVFP